MKSSKFLLSFCEYSQSQETSVRCLWLRPKLISFSPLHNLSTLIESLGSFYNWLGVFSVSVHRNSYVRSPGGFYQDKTKEKGSTSDF